MIVVRLGPYTLAQICEYFWPGYVNFYISANSFAKDSSPQPSNWIVLSCPRATCKWRHRYFDEQVVQSRRTNVSAVVTDSLDLSLISCLYFLHYRSYSIPKNIPEL